MTVCAASFPTGNLTPEGKAAHQQCANQGVARRFFRFPDGWAAHVELCAPHALLWDDHTGRAHLEPLGEWAT